MDNLTISVAETMQYLSNIKMSDTSCTTKNIECHTFYMAWVIKLLSNIFIDQTDFVIKSQFNIYVMSYILNYLDHTQFNSIFSSIDDNLDKLYQAMFHMHWKQLILSILN